MGDFVLGGFGPLGDSVLWDYIRWDFILGDFILGDLVRERNKSTEYSDLIHLNYKIFLSSIYCRFMYMM